MTAHVDADEKAGEAWRLLWDALRAARSGAPMVRADAAETADALALAAARGVVGLVERGLGRASTANVERSRAGRATMLQAHDALVGAGVAHAFFKGPFADGVLWGGRGERSFTDVDILVAPADDACAVAALSRLRFKVAPMRAQRATMAAGKARLLLPPPLLLAIDLHRRPVDQPPFRARAADVLAALRTYHTRDGALPGPRPEHMIVWSAANLAGGRLQGLAAQAADAAAWAEQPGFDWALLVDTARRWRAKAPTFGLLRLLQAHLAVEVHRGALLMLAPKSYARAKQVEGIFGMDGVPLEHTHGLAGVVHVEWPLSGRRMWPVTRVLRTAGLRAADAVLARTRPRPFT